MDAMGCIYIYYIQKNDEIPENRTKLTFYVLFWVSTETLDAICRRYDFQEKDTSPSRGEQSEILPDVGDA